MSEPLFSRRLRAADLGAAGQSVTIAADGAEREAIARAFDLLSLERFEGEFVLKRRRDGMIAVEGCVFAQVEQACVVTLEPVASTVRETVSLRFAEGAPVRTGRTEVEVRIEDEDPPEPLVGGAVDLGAVMMEHLALGLDPFPRKPGATLPTLAEPSDDVTATLGAVARLPRRPG